MPRYNPADIEPRQQAYWEEHKTFATPEKPGPKETLCLGHVPLPQRRRVARRPPGRIHGDGYRLVDTPECEAKASCIRWDLMPSDCPPKNTRSRPANIPRIQTQRNIDNFTRQLKMLGFSYDWDRVLATTDEDYFRWTQFIFLVLVTIPGSMTSHKKDARFLSCRFPMMSRRKARQRSPSTLIRDSHRLAYLDDALVNWCPNLGTVLANEEVVDGKSEVGGHPVKRIPLRQWMLAHYRLRRTVA